MNSSNEPNIKFEDSTDIPATKSDGQAPLRVEELVGTRIPPPEHHNRPTEPLGIEHRDLYAEADRNLEATELSPKVDRHQDLFAEAQHELQAPSVHQNPYDGLEDNWPQIEDQFGAKTPSPEHQDHPVSATEPLEIEHQDLYAEEQNELQAPSVHQNPYDGLENNWPQIEDQFGARTPSPEHQDHPVSATKPLEVEHQDLYAEADRNLEATELSPKVVHRQDLFAEVQHELQAPSVHQNPYDGLEHNWPQIEDQIYKTNESVSGKKSKKRKRKQSQKKTPRVIARDSPEFDDSNEPTVTETPDSAQSHNDLREQLIGEILENSLKSLCSASDDPEKTQRKLRRSSILQTKILPQDLLDDILNSGQDLLVAPGAKSANKKRKPKKSSSSTSSSAVARPAKVCEPSDFTPHLNGSDELIGWESLDVDDDDDDDDVDYYDDDYDEKNSYSASEGDSDSFQSTTTAAAAAAAGRKRSKKKRKRTLSTYDDEGTSTASDLVENSTTDDGSANYNDFGCLNPTRPNQEDWYLPEFQPIVLLQRITPAHIAKYKRRPGRPRKSNIAKKHTRSYFVPNLGRDPLKLTLKLSAAPRSFEVVPSNTILIGPGGTFNLNGSDLNEVKQEVTDKEEDFLPSVEGSVERLGEEGEGAGTDVAQEPQTQPSKEPEEPDGVPETTRFEKTDKASEHDELSNEDREDSEPEDEDEEEEEEEDEDEGGADEDLQENLIDIKDNIVEDADALDERDSLEEVCRETINDLKRLEDAEESGSEDEGPASPTPSEHLRPDFLAPPSSPAPSELCSSSPMVEHNGMGVAPDAPATSPAYPSSSPAPPTQNDQSKGEDRPKPLGEPTFQWGNSEVNESAGSPSSEDHDPLQIPDQTPGAGSGDSGSSAMLNATNESLLRGFLSESGDKGAPPVTLANQDGLLALGSEYMSLERLGEGAFRCDVCGERANDAEGLGEHRSRSGHFKCGQPDCGGQVFKSSDDLATHARVSHPPQFPRPPLVMINQSLQSPPVQQLAQQVQRLPMPEPYLNQALNSHAPMVQLHQLMPQPGQGFPTDAARRPPPLYRVPAPTSMAPPPHITPQFSNTQQMMSQMFNQQYRHPQTGFMQQMQPNQQQMQPNQQQMQQQQQRPNFMQQMQQPRGPQPQQRMPSPQQRQQQMPQIRAKRMATGPPLGTSPNAKRRMDMLIPDRHDNADCHVIAMQKRTDTGPVINSVEGSKIHLTDSITMSAVRQPGNAAVTATPIGSAKNKSDAKAVANVLASRGITVTPAGGGGGGGAARATNQRQTTPRPTQAPPAPTPVTTLNLNSAISIIPTGSQNSGFAVPQNRAINRSQNQTNVVERPPRPPTVDLTGDGPSMGGHSRQMHGGNMRGRMRGRPPGSGSGGGRNQCQICDKAFSTEESLAQHMQLHRSPGKLPYRCNLCPAQYPTQQGLLQHRQVYHKEPATSSGELALPVVDLKQPGTLSRLASMGIQHYLPLSQLSSQQGGYFGLPIVSIDGARNPAVCNLGALGASNILSLGPMKPLPR